MIVWLTMGGVWVLDRILKVFIQANFIPGESLKLIPKVLHITYVLNSGAAFGLMAGQIWIFVGAAILVLGGIIYGSFRVPRSEIMIRLALGMIGGGALGNLYDRLTTGLVVDYLDFQIWQFVFNFADSMVVIGVGLVLLRLYRDEMDQRKLKNSTQTPRSAEQVKEVVSK